MSVLIYLSGMLLVMFGMQFMVEDGLNWAGYMLYITASTSFIALPHEPLVLYYGTEYNIIITVLMAVLPTITGCYIDYAVLGPVARSRRLQGLKESIWLHKTIRYYKRMPFITVAAAALTPVPFYPVRLLSIVSEYPVNKYTAAVLCGRLPRYLFLAAGGKMAGLDIRLMIFIFVLGFLWYIVYQLRTGRAQQNKIS